VICDVCYIWQSWKRIRRSGCVVPVCSIALRGGAHGGVASVAIGCESLFSTSPYTRNPLLSQINLFSYHSKDVYLYSDRNVKFDVMKESECMCSFVTKFSLRKHEWYPRTYSEI
jgi:hypothetical protein